ncbi:MAG: hypothetical protein ABJC36_10265, partial [Gemmatimonadales bacterium]
QIIATARQGGQARVFETRPGALRGVSKATPVRMAAPTAPTPAAATHALPDPIAEGVTRPGPYAPTEKQVVFYQRLAESPVFTEDERRRALEWLASKATRQTIKDQIDWLKRQVETRRSSRGQSSAA